jgi:hypothetical protein
VPRGHGGGCIYLCGAPLFEALRVGLYMLVWCHRDVRCGRGCLVVLRSLSCRLVVVLCHCVVVLCCCPCHRHVFDVVVAVWLSCAVLYHVVSCRMNPAPRCGGSLQICSKSCRFSEICFCVKSKDEAVPVRIGSDSVSSRAGSERPHGVSPTSPFGRPAWE